MLHSYQFQLLVFVNVLMDKLQIMMVLNVLLAHNTVLAVHHKPTVLLVYHLHSLLIFQLDYVNQIVILTNILEPVQVIQMEETQVQIHQQTQVQIHQ